MTHDEIERFLGGEPRYCAFASLRRDVPKGRTEQEQLALSAADGMIDRISMRRLGRVSELVDAAVFLASNESSYISGQLISVDGGRF
jgi:NAD(P)-dependent dehydrogenase (short-subunit alcohol dehydrogenase family)